MMKRIILTLFLFFNFILLNSYSISGYTNLLESPVEGASLELYAQQPHMGNSLIDVTTSDENGYYIFNITDPGMYYVAAIIENPVVQTLFYDNVPSPFLATSIQVNNMTPNQTDIDFDFLSNIPSGDNSIFGTVTDISGTPVEAAEIAMFPFQYCNPWMTPFTTFSDSEGNYLLDELPDGEYILFVWHQFYYPYVYNGVQAWPQAEVIVLENGVALEIDVILESNESYIISGFVFDTQTNQPIIGAEIRGFSQNGNHPFGYGQGGCMLPETTTDENGFYQLLLPAGVYHLMAIDTQTNDVEFYDEASTPLTATWIVVDQNIENIDFYLNDNLNGDYSIAGTITSSGGNNEQIILAVAVSSDEDWEETVMANNDTGGYIIPDLPNGSYYVYGFSPAAIPTYYEDAIYFEEAVQVELQANVTDIDITLHVPQENGYLGCSGLVLDNLGNPVSNATVAFLDSFGNVHDYAYSDDNGAYQIPFLGSLNYTALATKTFYSTDSIQLPVYGNQTWDFTIAPFNTNIEETLINVESSLKILAYPNPFNPQTIISFSLPNFAPETKLSIFNIKGQKVYSKILNDLAAGSYAISWQAKDNQDKSLGSGIYLVRVSSGNYSGTGKLLLLK
ncbi:MAG: carboxypeptidase regulatory-like domain-containing protein [Candidatus Cloacimonadales bacterium]|nr:carboxypeptidase regulatory-like domain-containing protein [Candidatus Cloacimonadales bacterium]